MYKFRKILNVSPPDLIKFPNQEKLLSDIYDSEADTFIISENLYAYNVINIMSAVGLGYGLPTDFEKGTHKFNQAVKFKKNIEYFSGAKSAQNCIDLSNAVFDEKGYKRKFSEFKNIAKEINESYNVTWLRTEQDTAFGLAQSADTWDIIEDEKDIFPLLQYVTVGDGRVRQDHKAWDGIIRPVNDSFWDTRMPINDWNCRCIVIQLTEGKISDLKGVPQNDSKVFKQNPGKTGEIYPNTHPYYELPENLHKQQKINFGFEPVDDEIIKKNIKK